MQRVGGTGDYASACSLLSVKAMTAHICCRRAGMYRKKDRIIGRARADGDEQRDDRLTPPADAAPAWRSHRERRECQQRAGAGGEVSVSRR